MFNGDGFSQSIAYFGGDGKRGYGRGREEKNWHLDRDTSSFCALYRTKGVEKSL